MEKKLDIDGFTRTSFYLLLRGVTYQARGKKGQKYHPQNIKFSRCANVYVTLESSPFSHCDDEMKFGSG